MRKAIYGGIISLALILPGEGWGAEHSGAPDGEPVLQETTGLQGQITAVLRGEGQIELVTEPACVQGDAVEVACRGIEFFGPLPTINRHPTNAIFLGVVPEAALVLGPGERSLAFRADWANHIIRELDSGIIVDFDFESLRLAADYRQGLCGGELSVSLPYVHRGHGVLDRAIARWHSFFGLTNGLRDKFPDYQYRYVIVTREGPVYNDAGDRDGWGDPVVSFKRPVWRRTEDDELLSVRAGVKLPLGNPNQALGSGNWDYTVGALYQRQLTPHYRCYVNLDWVFVGRPEWENVGYQDMLVTCWALECAVKRDTSVVAQYRTQRNALRVGSKEADKDAQELAVGFNHRLSDDLVLSGGFNEDLNPETAPDLVVTASLTWEF